LRTGVAVFCVLPAFAVIVSVTRAADLTKYQPPAPPPLSAEAVYVVDVTSGTELFAQNVDEALPPASLTKIVTALVVLERAHPVDVVDILTADLVPPEQSQVGLVAGDRLSVRDLLYGLLIPSGNDAALALARHVGQATSDEPLSPGEAVTAFVALMNQRAADLGARASHFVNPTGMDAAGHVMSARDLAVLTEAALTDRLFAEIVATPNAVLPSEVVPDGYPVTTTNLLLAAGEVTGVKTGTTPEAGGCLVTSYRVGGNDILSVVLGSDVSQAAEEMQDSSARFAETRALLDAVNADYVWLDPAVPGAIAGLQEELRVWDVATEAGTLVPVPAGRQAQIRYRLVLSPPSDPGESAGEIQFFVGDQLLSQQPARQEG
jgi:D-alanyl-D-alanine carboxypeptidase (penicillin-binding protein 5/6)